nr:hypothetical protein [Tanacetum cinerariifolium]
MSAVKIDQIVAQRVTDAIEAIAVYETKIRMAHDSMDQVVRRRAKVARNANNKRKWKRNSRDNRVQYPPHKRQNVNNELLMKNHQSRPTGSLSYPEVNATKNDTKSFMRGQGQSHEKSHGEFGKNNSHGHNRSFDRNRKNGLVYTHGRRFTHGSGQRTNNNAPRNNKAKNDMKIGAIELCDENGNEFIVNKQHVKPYQKDALEFDGDDDVTLDDEGGVT